VEARGRLDLVVTGEAACRPAVFLEAVARELVADRAAAFEHVRATVDARPARPNPGWVIHDWRPAAASRQCLTRGGGPDRATSSRSPVMPELRILIVCNHIAPMPTLTR
jgi:hypothetical protein